MKFTHLGRTGLKVSRLCLGTMNFGPRRPPSPKLTRSWTPLTTAGINFFDTANALRRSEHRAETRKSRQLVRQWWRPAGADRSRHQGLRRHGARWPNDGKLSALNIRRALDASLKRLQTDYIDLYQFHHIDRGTPWEEIWQAIEVAVQAGQDPLRRQQQLRRLAHRQRAGRRGAAEPDRPGQ